MGRPHRPNPTPKAQPDGWKPTAEAKSWREQRRKTHPRQETAKERKARKRHEAEIRNTVAAEAAE